MTASPRHSRSHKFNANRAHDALRFCERRSKASRAVLIAAALDEDSRAVNPAERLRQLVEQIEHADEVGLDAFGVGEHHRREFLNSAPAVILGAAAARTQRIRLTSAVTVLSAEDPLCCREDAQR